MSEGKPYEYMKYVFADMEEYRETIGEDDLLDMQDEYISNFFAIYSGNVLFVTFSNTSPFHRDYLKLVQSQRTNASYLELPSLYSQEGLTFMPNDVHPTAKGHQVIANEIYDYVKKQLSCN